MFEDAKAGQDAGRVPEINHERDDQGQGAHLQSLSWKERQSETQRRTDEPHLDFAFLLAAGEGEEIEERHAQQQLQTEESRLPERQRHGRAEMLHLPEPVQESSNDARGQKQADPKPQ